MNQEVALCRTATMIDKDYFPIEEAMLVYAKIPKEIDFLNKPRYRFWDYSLALKIKELENVKSIMDISPVYDVSFKVIAEYYGLEINQVYPEEGLLMPIVGHKYDLVTCFGVLDHVSNLNDYFIRYLRHLNMGGFAIFTSDNETKNANKKTVITPNVLMELSFLVEDVGYQLYDQENCVETYYNMNIKNGLHSLVIHRVGRW